MQNPPGTGFFVWNNAIKMFVLFFVCQALVLVLSGATLPPPKGVHVAEGQLTWTPATENATYTVEYCRTDLRAKLDGVDGCQEVPECVQISSSSCNVSSVRQGRTCFSVRVRADRDGQTSGAVEACSLHGEDCSPDFSLSPGVGSMAVMLSRRSSLVDDYADHVKHQIYFGKEGEQLKMQDDPTLASETFKDLEEGQRYCVSVQYTLFLTAVGHPRCMRCETTLVTSVRDGAIITAVVVFIVLLILVPIVSYGLIYHFKKIKKLMKVPYEIPDLFPEPPSERRVLMPPSTEEHYDVITSLTPVDSRS